MDSAGLALPADNRVYQRNSKGAATIAFGAARPVRVRVRKGTKVVLPWRESKGRIEGVPTGGPYTLEFEARNGSNAVVRDILVGDLWVLAGQSNMDGCGKLLDLEPPSPMVHCFYHDDTWDGAQDPLCYVLESIDPVHTAHLPNVEEVAKARAWERRWREYGAGLGVRFGKDLNQATGVPIGLIMCSHGGTSLEQWDPAKKELGGQSLYGSMMRRVMACGGAVAGMAWYQGESDANEQLAPTYKDRMKAFIAAVRKDFKDPRLPFLQVQIGRFFIDETQFPPVWWDLVQQAQLDVQREVKGVGTTSPIDGTLSDAIHIDAASCRRTGARLAELALVLKYGKRAPLALIPDKVRIANKARTQIEITYANVRGKLAPASGVQGFWVEDAKNGRILVTAAVAKGNRVLLTLERSVGEATLWYGRNTNPLTNLHDKLFAAPVFGPVAVGIR